MMMIILIHILSFHNFLCFYVTKLTHCLHPHQWWQLIDIQWLAEWSSQLPRSSVYCCRRSENDVTRGSRWLLLGTLWPTSDRSWWGYHSAIKLGLFPVEHALTAKIGAGPAYLVVTMGALLQISLEQKLFFIICKTLRP